MPEAAMNRREFMSTTVTALLGLVGAGVEGLAGEPVDASAIAKRVGISDAAYEQAWRRAAALVAQMTMAEKISQVGVGSPPIQRLGIAAYQWPCEGCHGLVCPAGGTVPTTSFPAVLALACAWNPELTRRVYTAVSDEARAYNRRYGHSVSFLRGPMPQLPDPRWGRCLESPGEDPCLAGTFAVQWACGMQGDDPNYLKSVACTACFICNDQENIRHIGGAAVEPRSFWEYYTRPFRSCVVDGDAFAVMTGLNSLNGVPCTASRFLLTELLRDRWKFRGFVVSDCDSVGTIAAMTEANIGQHYVPTETQAAAVAMHAGCDLDFGDTSQKYLAQAVEQKLVTDVEIGQAVTRQLTARFLLGEFDPSEQVPYSRIGAEELDSPAHRELAVEAARQSIVLLKNDHRFLPLDKGTLKTVAVIGPMAGMCHLGFGYSGLPWVRISLLAGIAAALGAELPDSRVWFGEPIDTVNPAFSTEGTSDGGRSVSAGDNNFFGFRPQDFTGKNQLTLRVASGGSGGTIHVHLDALKEPPVASLEVHPTGGWENWVNISAPLHGVSGQHKVYFGFSGPGNQDLFHVQWFELEPAAARPSSGRRRVIFEPGCTVGGPKNPLLFERAVDAARQADVAILVCGLDENVDMEGRDRQNVDLPPVQHELIQAVYGANPKTVLVLNSNNTVAVNWEQQHLPAIIGAIHVGQAQGTAIADVLFGDYNPGGKTCCTWYKSADQLPPHNDYDITKGRTYMYCESEPLYPFGHGLSYTSFRFSDLRTSGATLGPAGSLTVDAAITNTGRRAGAEVVQFYIRAPKSPVKRPSKQLVGFQRLELKAGESRRVRFTLPYHTQALWYWREERRRFALEPGLAQLLIGSSSADIRLTGEVRLEPCTDTQLGEPRTLRTHALDSTVL